MNQEPTTRFGPIRSNLRVKVTLGIAIPLILILSAITVAQLIRHRAAVLHSAAIIASNVGEVNGDGLPLALLVTDTSMIALDASLRVDFYENVVWLVAIILVTIGVVNFALNHFVIKRVTLLAQALTGFGRGKHDLRLPVGSPDEIGQLANAFNEMGQRVESEEAQNRALSKHLAHQNKLRGQLFKKLLTAQEDERKRLAREIHDQLGQSMSGLAFQAEVLQRYLPSEAKQASSHLNQIMDLIKTTTDSMYALILALRPSVLDDLGLAVALRSHAERVFDGTGITYKINAETFDGRLPSEMEIAIYRLFQEALNNIIRHASSKHVALQLIRHNDAFEGAIEDDGRGFNPEEINNYRDQPRGLGLLGMQERVEQFGGALDISSKYGQGTIIKFRIPFPLNQGGTKSHE